MPIDATITPITRTEQYLDGIANETTEGIPPYPITREEMYLDAIANGNADSVPVPITRTEMYLNAIAQNAAGGGGGGGSSWTLIGTKEFEVSTTSTSETSVGDVPLEFESLSAEDIIWVHIRDKAGKRNGYFFGSDSFYVNEAKANGSTTSLSYKGIIIARYNNNSFAVTTLLRGVYPDNVYQANNNKKAVIKCLYNASNTGTIDGTFKVDVYKLTPAAGMVMFE